MPYDKKRIGRRLKSIRIDRDLSQEELANKAGTSAGTIASIESGRSGIGLETAFNITDALDCTLDELVCRKDHVA